METERTRDSALGVILKGRCEALSNIADAKVATVLGEDLLRSIFAVEWSHQFEQDRSAVVAQLRQIINDRLEEQRLGGGQK